MLFDILQLPYRIGLEISMQHQGHYEPLRNLDVVVMLLDILQLPYRIGLEMRMQDQDYNEPLHNRA